MELPIEMRERYLKRRSNDLEDCLRALNQEEFKSIEKIGHQLKGNAETFGHIELNEIAIELEKAAKTENSKQVELLLRKFSNWLSTKLS